MCIACAIPVRGRTLGAECLASALGPDAPVLEVPRREPGAGARLAARAAFLAAALTTMLPWSRFGPGSEAFGAWSTETRWSLLAALAAVAGVLISVAGHRVRARVPGWDVATVSTAAILVLSSILAIARPPAFSSPWLGPWLALAGGLVALVTSTIALVGAHVREPAHV
jgi:hypothetical protein